MAANTYGRQTVVSATNKSGGGLIAGDVCVIDTTNNLAFTTDTSGGFTGTVGIAQGTIANNAAGLFAIAGYVALVNVNASVTRGHYGKTYTVAKQATDAGASRGVGTFCEFTTGGTTPDAIMWPVDLLGSSLTNPMTTEGDLIYGGASGTPTRRAVGTGAYGLISDGTDPVWAEILPWHVSIIPMIWTSDAATGTWAIVAAAGPTTTGLQPFYIPGSSANSGSGANLRNTSLAQNDAWAVDVILAKGTWDATFWVYENTNAGIITLNQDGSSMGTVDTYAAAATATSVSITGWSVAATGKKRMQLKMATKNASSSGYVLNIYAIEFRRTA